MAGGRPTEYNDQVCVKARAYLKECVDEIEEYHKTRGEKSDSYDRIVRVKLPTIEGLAVYLKINKDTIYEWEKEEGKEEFSDVLAELRAEQAKRLIDNGLSGDYNSSITKVLLTKHGYREGIDQTTDGKALPTPILNVFPNNDTRTQEEN